MKQINNFIQNINDTTTVLQQLEICKKYLKECITAINNIGVIETKYFHNILVYLFDNNSNNITLILNILDSNSEKYSKNNFFEDLIKYNGNDFEIPCSGCIMIENRNETYPIVLIKNNDNELTISFSYDTEEIDIAYENIRIDKVIDNIVKLV